MILESGEPTHEVIKPEEKAEAAHLSPRAVRRREQRARAIEHATAPLKTENSELRRRVEALESANPEKDEPPNEGQQAYEDAPGTETLPPRKSRKERAIERATAPLLERIKQLETGPGAETGASVPKPKRADFAQDEAGQEAFEDALVKWGNEKFAVEKALTDAQVAEQRRCERNLRNYGAQVGEAKKKYDDWDEVVNKEIFVGSAVQIAILELENGADVTYYLGSHPDYAERLGQMSQPSAVMEVGRLSARLAGGASVYNEAGGGFRPRPRVPAPVRTVSTGGASGAPTFAEIAARPNYAGKARDLKRALAERR